MFSNPVDVFVCTGKFINTKSNQTKVIVLPPGETHKVDHPYKNIGGMNISHYPVVRACDQPELPTA